MDEDVSVNVNNISYTLATDNDVPFGQTIHVGQAQYLDAYDGNSSPATQSFVYNEDKIQVLAYLYVLNESPLTSAQCAAVMANLTGSTDPNT